MSSMQRLWCNGLSIFFILMGVSPGLALDVTIVEGQSCPPGSRLMTYQEALADQSKVCHSMGQWYIGRLAGNGSIDGPGYECKIRQADDRTLGNAVCVPQTQALWSVSAFHNNSGHELTIYIPIRNGETLSSTNAFGIGRIGLDASDFGLIKFSRAVQHSSPCGTFWQVLIVSQKQIWSYYFNQAGTIDVTINADQSLNIVPSAGGQIVAGKAGPRC